MPRPRPIPAPAAAAVRGGTAATGGAQSVDRALELLSLVGRGGAGGIGLPDLVARTGLSRPTARRLMVALMTQALVEQDPVTRRYHLGPEAFLLGRFAAPRHGLLAQSEGSLRRLADETGDSAFVSVPQGDHLLCLHREEGSFPIRTHALVTGDRNPMGVGAAGIAFVAALPEAEAGALLARIGPQIAARIGQPAAVLEGDIALARQRGWALNPGRVVAGSWGVGRAVRWPDGRPAAALTVAAIDSRLGPERQLWVAGRLAAEVALIEERLAALFTPAARKEISA